MLSVYLSLSSAKPFKAILGFSGRLFLPKDITNTKTPICLIHGKDDDVVPYSSLDLAKGQLDRLGVKVDTLGIENLAHSIDMEGINFAVEFLKGI
jgi:phospholipase/carboxylesterase